MTDVQDLSVSYLLIERDGRVGGLEVEPGPPPLVSGLLVSAPHLTTSPPHDGERHDDGDEVLFVVSGAIRVRIEQADQEEQIEVGTGQAVVVPRGRWHQIDILEPAQVLHVTPGPNNAHR